MSKGPGPPPDEYNGCRSPAETIDTSTTTSTTSTTTPTTILANNNNYKEYSSSHNGSLTDSIGSDKESDSACNCGSPSDEHITEPDHNTFDWWFHRKSSYKTR